MSLDLAVLCPVPAVCLTAIRGSSMHPWAVAVYPLGDPALPAVRPRALDDKGGRGGPSLCLAWQGGGHRQESLGSSGASACAVLAPSPGLCESRQHSTSELAPASRLSFWGQSLEGHQ